MDVIVINHCSFKKFLSRCILGSLSIIWKQRTQVEIIQSVMRLILESSGRSNGRSLSTCQDVSGTAQSSEILNHQAPRCPGGQKENLFCSSPLLASVCQLLHPLLSALVSTVCMLIILLDCLVPGGAGFCLRCNHFWTWRRQNWQYLGWKQPRLNFSGLRWPLPHNLEKFNTHLA